MLDSIFSSCLRLNLYLANVKLLGMSSKAIRFELGLNSHADFDKIDLQNRGI